MSVADRPPWCHETLDSDSGRLTCQIVGSHAGNQHEAQSGDVLYTWEAGRAGYATATIPSASD